VRRMLLLGLGGAAGYVMGTRAGRGRYLELKNMWERALNEGSLGEMSKKLQETKLGETLGMKHNSEGGTSYGSESSWSGQSGTSGSQYATGTSTAGSEFADIRDSADDQAREFR
jgi:hypothetical protein